jgi:hypothetical protein
MATPEPGLIRHLTSRDAASCGRNINIDYLRESKYSDMNNSLAAQTAMLERTSAEDFPLKGLPEMVAFFVFIALQFPSRPSALQPVPRQQGITILSS